ncbi:hypothetical protein DB35_05445 [Streptomyces abyssalis]|uniref:hypothetical protein n=1 Tax=Streptomyces abyssalis TaxID=933944 RepID=UPI00085C71F5|nr:hypothetical protein [Streptomyces abyssalis]OEU95339.1 hypothetical protein DB35_05445 [Streptomyces abyssalis]
MAADGRGCVRVFVSAVVLLLATLLGAESASAQVAAQGLRPVPAAASYSAVPHESSSTSEDDSKPRHGPRRSAGVKAPAGGSGRVCDCDFRTRSAYFYARNVTLRDGAPSGCSVGLPVLLQTFRC